MEIIRTRYLPPTENLGPRVRVWTSGGCRTIHRAEHAPATPDDHDAAARALALRLRWSGELVRGDLSFDEAGHVYVLATGARVRITEPEAVCA